MNTIQQPEPLAVELRLPEDTKRLLLARAASRGQSVEDYIAVIIERNVVGASTKLDEILAPFRKDVAESGMTEEELGEFFQKELDDMRAERRQGTRPR